MIAAFSITPVGTAEGGRGGGAGSAGSVGSVGSVGDAVAEAVRIVRASGLPNETNAMFTNVEGDWDQVMGVIKACVDKVAEIAPRVSVVIKVDHRPGASAGGGGGLVAKVASVEERLASERRRS